MTTFVRVVLAVLLGAAGAAGAQPVYKYTDPKGVTVYTDDPNAAAKSQKIDIPPPASATGAPPPARLSELDQQMLGDAQRRSAALDRATDDIISSSRVLREAEERREQGIEPREGERIGRRFRPEYWQRRQAEEQEVMAARARLDDALARRNALR
ncbi:MAG TPA: DUF4124 domain-containing protein [Burkholderiales bacterium]